MSENVCVEKANDLKSGVVKIVLVEVRIQLVKQKIFHRKHSVYQNDDYLSII